MENLHLQSDHSQRASSMLGHLLCKQAFISVYSTIQSQILASRRSIEVLSLQE